MATRSEQEHHILKCLLKKPMRGAELAERLAAKYPGHNYDNPRTISRQLGDMCKAGVVIKSGTRSRPLFSRP